VLEDTTFRADAMRPEDLSREYGWPISNQKRARAKGKFPPSYRIGRRLYWRKATIDRWIEEQEAETAQQGGNAEVPQHNGDTEVKRHGQEAQAVQLGGNHDVA
jgi:predicted DNA-binding transcriptional regulator AlpA